MRRYDTRELSMKAVVRHGRWDVRYDDVPDVPDAPDPGPGGVRVELGPAALAGPDRDRHLKVPV